MPRSAKHLVGGEKGVLRRTGVLCEPIGAAAARVESLRIGKITADGGRAGQRGGMAAVGRCDRVREFMSGGGRAGASKVRKQIVDAAVIHEAALGVEDGGFRRNGNLRAFY